MKNYINKFEINEQEVLFDDSKLNQIDKNNYISIAKTKFAFLSNVENLSKTNWQFYSDIIQNVSIDVTELYLKQDIKFSLTYLKIDDIDNTSEFDGQFGFTCINGNTLYTEYINLYDYGYYKGYKGILELYKIKPFNAFDDVYFTVTINCEAILLNHIYYLGNESNSSLSGKIYILPNLYNILPEKTNKLFTTNITQTYTSQIFANFLLDIRIYTDNIPQISFFQVKCKNNEYAVQFTYVDENEGVYYINYSSTIKSNYIKTNTADEKIVELFVDWSVIPDDTILSVNRDTLIISDICLQPLSYNIQNDISKLTYDTTVITSEIYNPYLIGHYINYNGIIKEHPIFNISKHFVNEGDKFCLKINNLSDNTNAVSYAIYNNTDIYDESTLIALGPNAILKNNGEYTFTIPSGGVVLLYTVYKNHIQLYNTSSLNDNFDKINDDIESLSSNFNIKEEISYNSILPDKYIASIQGNILEYSGYISKIYDVTDIKTVYLEINGLMDDTGAMAYAIYNDDVLLNNTTLLYVGPNLKKSLNGITNKIDIPINAKVLVTTIFNGNRNANATSILFNYKSDPDLYIENKINDIINKDICYVEVDNDILKYCSKYNDDYDLIVHFKHCMNNKLMTFNNVGIAPNSEKYPSTNFYRTITMLNNPGSDNIGPFNVYKDNSVGNGVGGFTGGNHCYGENYGDNQVLTATSDSYTFYLDDIKIENGFKGYGKTVKVVTENTLFDTRIAPLEGETILNSPLIKEMVSYTLTDTNIEVCATHRFLKDVTLSYYGQQSVFSNESHIITLLGAYPEWTEIANITDFIKSDYPNYKCLSLKSQNGYENDILIDCGLGTRYMLKEESNIFKYSSGKTYTQLLDGNNIKQNDVLYWSGVYNWGCIIDDEYNYIYKYNIGNKKYLNICSKQQYKNILVDTPIDIINSNVKQSGEHITIEDYIGKYIILNSDGIGSITVEIN